MKNKVLMFIGESIVDLIQLAVTVVVAAHVFLVAAVVIAVVAGSL